MILTVRLQPKEARALTAMCRRFGFTDAQHLLTGVRNVNPTSLCEAVTTVLNALDAAGRLPAQTAAGPIVSAESDTHVTVAFVVDKADLRIPLEAAHRSGVKPPAIPR